jgi:hypothetical protein
MRQKGILLGFVEAMHFVHKHDGAVAGAPGMLGSGHDVFDFANSGEYGAEGDKFRMRAPSDQSRERGLAASRRSPQDHGTEVVGFDGRAQRFSRAQKRFLARKLLERTRTHAFCERRACGDLLRFHFGEKAHAGFAHGSVVTLRITLPPLIRLVAPVCAQGV